MSEGGDSKENETKRYRLVLIIRGGGCRGSIDWGTDGGEVMLIRVKSNFQLLSAGCVRVTGGGDGCRCFWHRWCVCVFGPDCLQVSSLCIFQTDSHQCDIYIQKVSILLEF